jgi:hypothetical protein
LSQQDSAISGAESTAKAKEAAEISLMMFMAVSVLAESEQFSSDKLIFAGVLAGAKQVSRQLLDLVFSGTMPDPPCALFCVPPTC